jgi:hypothetical protein
MDDFDPLQGDAVEDQIAPVQLSPNPVLLEALDERPGMGSLFDLAKTLAQLAVIRRAARGLSLAI